MLDVLLEQASSIVYVVLAGALSSVGFLAESAGIEALMQGHSVLGAWEAVVGLLLLVAGVKLVREKLLGTVTDPADA